MGDMIPWCICCGRSRAVCKRDGGCTKVDPTVRTSFRPEYYEGGTRVVVDNVPVRMARTFGFFSRWMRAACNRGTQKDGLASDYDWKQDHELRRQVELLFPAETAARKAKEAAEAEAVKEAA